MAIQFDTITGPVAGADGGGDRPFRQSRLGGLVVTDGHGRFYEPASRGLMFIAQAVVTAPVIYSTAAGTGGPLIWNGSTKINAGIIAVGWGITTAAAAAGALGITGNTGQTSAPTATTVIDGSSNCFLGGYPSNCTAYRVGTVTNAGRYLLPFAQVHTGAVSVDTAPMTWVELSSSIIVPPNCWASVAASATLTSAVMQIGIVWEETPI